MSASQVGGLLELSTPSPLVYLGLNISLHSGESVGVSQTDFISRVSELKMSDFGPSGQLCLPSEQVRTRFRRILGSFVWLLQTQHQVAFAVIKYAADSPFRCSSFSAVKEMVSSANKIVQSLRSRPSIIFYRPLFDVVPSNSDLQSAKLMSFSDCGFASLWDSKSIESAFVILPRPNSRDGEIVTRGHLLDGSVRKISRTARSTLAGGR